ncbi:MAG: hypothetical protein OXK81_15025 [Chloroflexota bacterium]|nr:hypothetical protein [Chloroflexota bacterium]MDE2930981.1 hypothetical protein [Chloroflexota bacterium]
MAEDVGLILFAGKHGATALERLVYDSHIAIAKDLVAKARTAGGFAPIIVATSQPESFGDIAPEILIEPTARPSRFHFGKTLANIVARHGISRVLYIGGGSSPLLSVAELATLRDAVIRLDHGLIANNFFSADFIGFHPASALTAVDLPQKRDNGLARQLVQEASLLHKPLEPTIAAMFDIDTPTDLAMLALHPLCGPHTRAYLEDNEVARQLSRLVGRLREAMPTFVRPHEEVILAGRVSAQLWPLLRRDMACRIRVFSEERGMSTSTRPVRSLLGFYLEEAGPKAFFEAFSQMGDALFLDTRVLFAHGERKISGHDRFAADMGLISEIRDEPTRALAGAAWDAGFPVVMGGNAAVSGGLWALVDAAWRLHDDGALL